MAKAVANKYQNIIARIRALEADIEALDPSAQHWDAKRNAVANLAWAAAHVQLLSGETRKPGKVDLDALARARAQEKYDAEHEPSLQDRGMTPDGFNSSIGDY